MKKFTIYATSYYCYSCSAISHSDGGDENMRQDAVLVISTDGSELSAEVVFGYELPQCLDDFLAMCDDSAAWENERETLLSVLCPELGDGQEPWKSLVWG